MSTPTLRRTDRVMTTDTALRALACGRVGRLATVSEDGYPYCVPLLYIWADNRVFLHGTRARSHWQENVKHMPQACFEIDEAGDVYDYGRFECDTGLAFQSVILFGRVCLVEEISTKQWFYEQLMDKYGKPDTGRPKNFFPRLAETNVYSMTVERLSGKEGLLPKISDQWPAKDQTKTPNARPS